MRWSLRQETAPLFTQPPITQSLVDAKLRWMSFVQTSDGCSDAMSLKRGTSVELLPGDVQALWKFMQILSGNYMAFVLLVTVHYFQPTQ